MRLHRRNFIYLLSLLLSIGTLHAQVGINTIDPTETLDVNGTLRIRGGEYLNSNSEPWLLTASSEGVIKRLPANTFTSVMSDLVVNTRFNDTVWVQVPSGYDDFQLDISSENPCHRWIYASLRYVGHETILLGASARGMSLKSDAQLTTIGIPADGQSWGASFHVFWDRDKVVTCNSYGNKGKPAIASTASYLYDFWIRRTANNVVAFVWGAINNPAQITNHTAIESATLKWNFVFTKL